MNIKKHLSVFMIVPLLILSGCENPLVQDILRRAAELEGIKIFAADSEGNAAGNISSGLDPSFTPGHVSYTAEVPFNTGIIRITGIPGDEGSISYSLNGGPETASGEFAFPPSSYRAVVAIHVEQEYRDKRVYTLEIKRQLPSWLDGIMIETKAGSEWPKAELSPSYSSSVLSYTAGTPQNAEAVKVTVKVMKDVSIRFRQDGGSVDEKDGTAPIFDGDTSGEFDYWYKEYPFPIASMPHQSRIYLMVYIPEEVRAVLPDLPEYVEYVIKAARPGQVKVDPDQEALFSAGLHDRYVVQGTALPFSFIPPFGSVTRRIVCRSDEGYEIVLNPDPDGVYAFVMPPGEILTLRAEWDFVTPRSDVKYVREGGTGEGESWANASGDLQAMIDKAAEELEGLPPDAVREIWIARGTYSPLWAWAESDPTDDDPPWASAITASQRTEKRHRSFVLREGVHIYGGFAGHEESRDQRSPNPENAAVGDLPGLHGTVLSGNLGSAGNTAHVVVAAGINKHTILADLVVSGGNCVTSIGDITINGKNIEDCGGAGIQSVECSRAMEFTRLVVRGNIAKFGAGIFNFKSSPTLSGLVIRDNTASSKPSGYSGGTAGGGSGAGILNGYDPDGSTGAGSASQISACSPLFTGGTIIEANISDNGAGMYNNYAGPVLDNVIIRGNTGLFTGGIFSSISVLTVLNTEISGNTGGMFGGGLGISGGGSGINEARMILVNTRVFNNTGGFGGGICNSTYCETILINTEITGNSASSFGGGICLNDKTSKLRVINATISGNSSGRGGAMAYQSAVSGTGYEVFFDNSILWANTSSAIYHNLGILMLPAADDPAVYRTSLVEHQGGLVNEGSITPHSLSSADLFESGYRLKQNSLTVDNGNDGHYPVSSSASVQAAFSDIQTIISDLSLVDPSLVETIKNYLLSPWGASRFRGGGIDLGAYEKQ
jgi:hypothetical protein